MTRRAITVILAGLAISAWGAAPAGADVFGPIGMGSDGFLVNEGAPGERQQALYAHDPAVSADGRYVAFDGYFGGLSGVWRRDLSSGEVQPVAVGAQFPGSEACIADQPCDAELPSISANGQEVSFTTTAPLAPANDTNAAPDVYVRDMSIPASQPCLEEASRPAQHCAFTLVSAVNHGAAGLSYSGSSADGSVASGRSAISGDGEEVTFVTTAVSDLAGCDSEPASEGACSEEAIEPRTPALQVAVRDLASAETELVSVEDEPSTGAPRIPNVPVSGSESGRVFGAVYAPGGGNAPPFPFNNRPYSLPPAIGASISADGSTVAWLGSTVYKQAPMLSGEDSEQYAEPLWRRIADGPEAPIRRVTGGSEPQNPACAASGETTLHFAIAEAASDPCQGPFAVLATSDVWSDSLGDAVPQLSADGYTVAFLATAQLISLGSDFGLSGEGRPSDAYVADMHPGLTRAQALRPLTELASGKQSERAATAPIVDIGVSPDGTQVAFSTERIEFPLDSLAYVSQPAAAVGMSELYDADLSNDTLTRVTGGYAGGLSEHPHVPVAAGQPPYPSVADGALSPSFSGDGSLLAFSSTASNLVYGDGNTPGEEFEFGSADGGDVFFTTRELFPAVATAGFISSAPSNPAIAPAWRIGVTSRSLANGTVRLYVQTPGAGSLSVSASGVVSVARSSAGSGRSAKPRHDATALVLRRVASAHTAAAPGPSGLLSITLSLAPRYSSLAQHRGGLTATAKVLFTSPGRPLLKQSVVVSFRRTARPKRRVRRAAARQGGVR